MLRWTHGVRYERSYNRLGTSLVVLPRHGQRALPQRSFVERGIIGDNEAMGLNVQCYSGYMADERPLRFQLNGHEYLVEEVLDQWYGPEHQLFKLRADDGNLYILRHETSVPNGEWELVSFRRT